MRRWLSFALATVMLFLAVACSKDNSSFKSDKISEDVSVSATEPLKMEDMSKELTYPFRNFCIELFQKGYDTKDKGNYMVSPVSVMTALAMTANGADSDTLRQMEATLFNGASIEDINSILGKYISNLSNRDKVKINIADSIWIKKDNKLTVNKSFLQKNKQYYNADVFISDFDDSTVKDINSWISVKTDGMIENMLDKIQEKAVMFLVNAICFDAKWQKIYTENQVNTGDFHNYNGSVNSNATLMTSDESKYLEDSKATGFIKDYEGGELGFAVLLPNKGVDVYDYAKSLNADAFYEMVTKPQDAKVIATLPAFSSEYEISLKDTLKDMRITNAFDADISDFSRLGAYSGGNICIGDVLHKTFLCVDAQGTKAGAATIVQMNAESSMVSEYKTVNVDRPFVFAIIDNHTGTPLFIGVEANIE